MRGLDLRRQRRRAPWRPGCRRRGVNWQRKSLRPNAGTEARLSPSSLRALPCVAYETKLSGTVRHSKVQVKALSVYSHSMLRFCIVVIRCCFRLREVSTVSTRERKRVLKRYSEESKFPFGREALFRLITIHPACFFRRQICWSFLVKWHLKQHWNS